MMRISFRSWNHWKSSSSLWIRVCLRCQPPNKRFRLAARVDWGMSPSLPPPLKRDPLDSAQMNDYESLLTGVLTGRIPVAEGERALSAFAIHDYHSNPS